MKNKLYSYARYAVIGLTTLSPALTLADIDYDSQIATTTALATVIGGDVLQTIGVVIGIVTGIIIFVMGVGYAINKLTRKTGMRKF